MPGPREARQRSSVVNKIKEGCGRSVPWSRFMLALFAELRRSEAGVTAIEYALVASLISIAAASVMLTVGTEVTGLFTQIANGF
jgi:pilus assembly protein Flp/PilA